MAEFEKTNGTADIADSWETSDGDLNELGTPVDDSNICRKSSVKVLDYPRKLSRRSSSIQVQSSIPRRRENMLTWHGWGFKDSSFESSAGKVCFKGNRYHISNQHLPHALNYLKSNLNIPESGDYSTPTLQFPSEDEYPTSKFTSEELDSIQELGIELTTDGSFRLARARGQSCGEVVKTRNKCLDRIPDAVAWPASHEEVVQLVKLADAQNFVIVPFGGGSSVTGALECPLQERRPILSLDLNLMNEILWLDTETLVVCVESGITGHDLERALQARSYTVGRAAASAELSTVGGLLATRMGGATADYGDMLVHARVVTPRGVLQKGSNAPRVSSGPDFHHVVLGSEGAFGVITEVCLKIRPLPEVVLHGAVLLPNWEAGVHFMHQVVRRRLQPADFRLLDEEQLQLVLALRPEPSIFDSILDTLKDQYITKWKGFDSKKMCMATMVYEGDEEDVLVQKRKVDAIAIAHNGVIAGERSGRIAGMLPIISGYLRDVALDCNTVMESAQGSISWCGISSAVGGARTAFTRKVTLLGGIRPSCNLSISQASDTGCRLIVDFTFGTYPAMDVPKAVEHVRAVIEKAITECSGNTPQHLGDKVGSNKFIPSIGRRLLLATKTQMDPNNVFRSI